METIKYLSRINGVPKRALLSLDLLSNGISKSRIFTLDEVVLD